jgi:hypothetical protein
MQTLRQIEKHMFTHTDKQTIKSHKTFVHATSQTNTESNIHRQTIT